MTEALAKRARHLLVGCALCLAAFALAPGDVAAQGAAVTGLAPADPQPAEDSLAPGLAVEYLNLFVRHVDGVERAGKGHDGGTLDMLDWNTLDGEVLTSGRDDGVGARITGFIRFEEPGTYLFAAQSNDGIRLLLGGKKILEDPDVHRDRFTENVPVKIETPGWYPFYLVYFERKGTSTLELYWQPPGADGFEFVPAEAFAHVKK